jgi:hypothetical protein
MKVKNEKNTSNEQSKKTATEDKCPYGHKFGVETEYYDDCDKCKIWDDCVDMEFKKQF